ncbi:MAG: carboxynorspermidine decarboxylase [Pseudomonadota bacterium]
MSEHHSSDDSDRHVAPAFELKRTVATTPAFIYDEGLIRKNLGLLAGTRSSCGLKILYSIKALPLASILELIKPEVDGFSVSSLFEARLAADALSGQGSIHITTPGLRVDEIESIAAISDFISFNSLRQYRRLSPFVPEKVRVGLRVNPGRSFLSDYRYDPCRPYSKLGVSLAETRAFFAQFTTGTGRIEGLHFHNQFSSRTFTSLAQTIEILERGLGEYFPRLRWLNIGGGYLFNSGEDLAELCIIVARLKEKWGLEVYFEPGKGVVGEAGCLVASVIDLFNSDGKTVAVLDTTVNHHPEVFEYQIQPSMDREHPDGTCSAVLAGCTCLSGDIFGEYTLAEPLALGDRVVFENIGAYSLIKANRFNGYNLPDVYAVDEKGAVRIVKRYAYDDYRRQWGKVES